MSSSLDYLRCDFMGVRGTELPLTFPSLSDSLTIKQVSTDFVLLQLITSRAKICVGLGDSILFLDYETYRS